MSTLLLVTLPGTLPWVLTYQLQTLILAPLKTFKQNLVV